MFNPKSARSRVLSVLVSGRTMTARQLASRFNVLHPHSVIAKLRKAGISIQTRKNRRGNAVYSYSSATA